MVPKGVNQEGKEDKMFKRLIIRGLRYFTWTVQEPAEEIRSLILEAGKDFRDFVSEMRLFFSSFPPK